MKVVVADDSMLIREGLARLLADGDCEVVGTAEDAAAVMREVELNRPDIVILDIKMPPDYTDEGIRAAHRIRATHPAIGVLVLSQYVESEYAMRLITDAPERVGYLLKERVSTIDVVLDALRRIEQGDCVIDPAIVANLMRRRRGDPGPLDRLTAREREVLALIAQGRSNAAVAAQLGMSPKTLESHVGQIMQRLDLHESPDDHRRVLAVLRYLRRDD